MKKLILKGKPQEICNQLKTLGDKCKEKGIEKPTILDLIEVNL